MIEQVNAVIDNVKGMKERNGRYIYHMWRNINYHESMLPQNEEQEQGNINCIVQYNKNQFQQ